MSVIERLQVKCDIYRGLAIEAERAGDAELLKSYETKAQQCLSHANSLLKQRRKGSKGNNS